MKEKDFLKAALSLVPGKVLWMTLAHSPHILGDTSPLIATCQLHIQTFLLSCHHPP